MTPGTPVDSDPAGEPWANASEPALVSDGLVEGV